MKFLLSDHLVINFFRFLLSGSTDCNIALWTVGNASPLSTKNLGSKVFCMTVIELKDNIISDEVLQNNVVACGLSSGLIMLLPLPSSKSPIKESWNTVSFKVTSGVPVSSLKFCWEYLYVASSDGGIAICAVKRDVSNGMVIVSLVHRQASHAGKQ